MSGISGTEGLSRLFDFRVDFFPVDGEPVAVADLVGKDALVTLSVRDGSPRYVHGQVRGVESLGLKTGRRRYRAHVVPKLWRLTQVHRSRIFQSKSVPDILKAVLGEGGVEVRLALSGSYATREYCVQYRESDFAFLSRLMEWEGIYYFFEHTEDGHTLVLGDKPSAHVPLPQGQTLPLRPSLGKEVVEAEYISALEVVHRLRPGAVHLKDFDFEKPAVDISGKGKAPEGLAALELYDYPAGYVAPGVGKAVASVRTEAAGVGGRTLTGEAVAPRLTPGYVLEVESAEDGTFAGEYVITEVVHSGVQPDVTAGSEALQGLYRNQFHLLPKAVPFRPRRLTPTPQIAGPQTATVTGPAGEEIHADAHGRIKVQFHWDREGKKDEKSSCWVRVGQPWGGPAWGDVWLPRIGQEVIVRFLEGDPDRPLVAGAVYNGANAVPYALPDEKTKSTRKSASSLGSDGFNEVRIEDSAGQEEVFTHAQKDEDLLTENDKVQRVFGYEGLLVKKDRKRTVEGHQALEVRFDDASLVEGNQTLLVQKNRDTRTAVSHDEAVEGNQTISIAKNITATVSQASSETVGLAKSVNIGAGYSVNIGLAFNEAVGGLRSIEIGGLHAEYVLGSRQETVAQNKTAQVKGDFDIRVEEGVASRVGKDIQEDVGGEFYQEAIGEAAYLAKSFSLKADVLTVLVAGHLALRIEKSGNIMLNAKTLTLDGSDIKIKGAKVQMLGAGSRKDASIQDRELQPLPEQLPEGVLELEVADGSGKPLANQEFKIELPDGTVKSGRLDGDGRARVEGVPAGQHPISFVGHDGSFGRA